MAVYKRNDRWWFAFQIRGIRYRRAVPEATSKKQAMAAETRFKNELLQGKYDLADEARLDITFAQHARKYLQWSKENKRSWRADVCRLRALEDHFGPKRLSDISPIDIERYKIERRSSITRRKKPRSLTTINHELALLRHAFSVALRDGYVRNHPMRNGRVRLFKVNNKIERYLTDEEEPRLLAACAGRSEHLRPIILTALYTGMRRGEIFNLKWPDVEFRHSLIHVRESKTDRPRSVHMPSNVRAEFEKLLLLAAENDYVLGNPHTGSARTDLKNGFDAVCKKAEIEGLRFHDLRHTFATRLARESGNIVDVAHVLGHSQISTTMRYAHAIPDRVAEAMERLARPKAEVVPIAIGRAEAVR